MEDSKKSEIISQLLKELMSEMKGSAGGKFKPVSAEIKTVSAKPIEIETADTEGPEEDKAEKGIEEPGEEGSMDLEDVLDKASEDEPQSAAGRRLAKLASMKRA